MAEITQKQNAKQVGKFPWRRYTVKDYSAEQFNFGGEDLTRGEIISELKAAGGSPEQIARYLFGLETSKRLSEECEPTTTGQIAVERTHGA